MINNFVGEFMFHPAPLEMSGNTCTHGCAYCFANIRKESRYAKTKSAIKQLRKTEVRTWTDFLIQNDYPICISNTTDPFSKTDELNTISFLHHWKNKKNGIFFQTKGGEKIDEALEIIGERRDIVWYISLSILDKEISKRIECNAPTPTERIELAKKLIEKGFLVIIAINPLSKLWLPENDFKELIKQCSEIGVSHFVVEQLHLNKKEIASFSNWRKSKFKEEEFTHTLEHKEDLKYARDCVDYIESSGLLPMKIGMPKQSYFFKDIRKTFGKISPNHYDVINYCFENKTENGFVLDYKTFESIITKGTEEMWDAEFKNFKEYIFKQSFSLWRGNQAVQTMTTLRQVLRLNWNEKSIKQSIQHNALFRKLKDKDGNDVLDENGNIKLFFDGKIYREKPQRILEWLGELNYAH